MASNVSVEGFQRDRYFARSWALLTRDKGWIKPVLVLTVAALVPIVGPLALLGYALEWARLTAWGVTSAPKQRDVRVGECIASGFRACVVVIVWGLVINVVSYLLRQIPQAGEMLYFIWSIFSMFIGLMMAVAMMRATIYQKIGAGLNIRAVWQMTTHDVAGLFRIFGLSLFISVLAGLAVCLVIIAGVASSLGSLAYSLGALGSASNTTLYYDQLAEVIMQFFYVMGPTLLVALVIGSLGTVLLSLLYYTAVALWMRQFNVASWRGEKDPLPPFVTDPRDAQTAQYAQPAQPAQYAQPQYQQPYQQPAQPQYQQPAQPQYQQPYQRSAQPAPTAQPQYQQPYQPAQPTPTAQPQYQQPAQPTPTVQPRYQQPYQQPTQPQNPPAAPTEPESPEQNGGVE